MPTFPKRFIALVFLLATSASSLAAQCPPSGILPAVEGAPVYNGSSKWIGSPNLSALIPVDHNWNGRGADENYMGRLWWWHEGFDARPNRLPPLEVSAVMVGAPDKKVVASRAAAKADGNWNAMFVLVRFPEAGCWKISGQYGDEKLMFLLDVGDS